MQPYLPKVEPKFDSKAANTLQTRKEITEVIEKREEDSVLEIAASRIVLRLKIIVMRLFKTF